MRNKATFRDGRKFRLKPHKPIAEWIVISDEKLPDAAENILKKQFKISERQAYRDRYSEIICEERTNWNLRNQLPKWADVRNTLKELIKLSEADLKRAYVDGRTEAAIAAGICRFFKKRNQPYPPILPKISNYPLADAREIIQHSIESLGIKEGRPSTKYSDIRFAAILASYWLALTGKIPKVSCYGINNGFMDFCLESFDKIGRNSGDSGYLSTPVLKPILLSGVKKIKKMYKK